MKTAQPLVSVVLPAHNVRDHVAEAIRSVLAQDYTNLEIIVVDDGSKDGTADLVADAFPTVRLFRKENGGAATARNLGMRESHGDYVAFLDADDVWLPGKLAVQIGHMEARPDVGLVCGNFSFWTADDDGRFPDPAGQYPAISEARAEAGKSGWVYHKLLLSNFVWTSTVVMRRALIERIGGYDERLRLGQDYDYWLRASRATEIHRLEGVMALYRRHSGSATARGHGTNHAVGILQNAVATWGLASPNGESISRTEFDARLFEIHFRAGYGWYRKGQVKKAFDEFARAIRRKPLRPRPWVYCGLCSLGIFRNALIGRQ